MGWYEETFRTTVVLVTASLVLAVPGFLGAGVSFALVIELAGLGLLLFAAREDFARLPTVMGNDLGGYGTVLWLGPVVAIVVCLLAFGATPSELQSLGGLVGLAGMVNYFLRPVYRAGGKILSVVARI